MYQARYIVTSAAVEYLMGQPVSDDPVALPFPRTVVVLKGSWPRLLWEEVGMDSEDCCPPTAVLWRTHNPKSPQLWGTEDGLALGLGSDGWRAPLGHAARELGWLALCAVQAITAHRLSVSAEGVVGVPEPAEPEGADGDGVGVIYIPKDEDVDGLPSTREGTRRSPKPHTVRGYWRRKPSGELGWWRSHRRGNSSEEPSQKTWTVKRRRERSDGSPK